jgi:hypothetical protein
MDRAVKFRDGGAEHRFFDIDFRAMTADPIAEVRRLYGWLGEPVTDEFETRMHAWWADNAGKHEPHMPADAATFGLDISRVRPLFDRYVSRAQRWVAH